MIITPTMILLPKGVGLHMDDRELVTTNILGEKYLSELVRIIFRVKSFDNSEVHSQRCMHLIG